MEVARWASINQKSNTEFMRYVFFVLLLLTGCDKNTSNTKEEIPGIKEEFPDTPGLIRTEIVDAGGNLSAIGYYLNGKKEGAWTEYTQDERVHRLTTYVNGKKEGVYLEFNAANNVSVRCFYHNDERHGKYVEYSSTGLQEDRFYSFGKLDGVAHKYYPNGNLMEEGYYRNDKREGISKWYDREGNKTLEYEYHEGELVKK